MSEYSVAIYNSLLHIAAANTKFYAELDKKPGTLQVLLPELYSLLLQYGYQDSYVISLIHRHYAVQDNERVVTHDYTPGFSPEDVTSLIVARSKPEAIDTSENVIPERWLRTGTPIEYRYTDHPEDVKRPDKEFFEKFQAKVEEHGITMLGIAYAPPALPPGKIYLESAGEGREQVISVVDEALLGDNVPPSTHHANPHHPTDFLHGIINNQPGRVLSTIVNINSANASSSLREDQSAYAYVKLNAEGSTFQSAWTIKKADESVHSVPVMECNHVCCIG